jgi:hypothetical protein
MTSTYSLKNKPRLRAVPDDLGRLATAAGAL